MPTFSIHGDGSLAQALTEESAYLAGLGGLSVLTEDFEGFAGGTYSGEPGALLTSVGTFVPVTPGNDNIGAGCGAACNDGLAVLDAATTPYSGRFAVEGAGGNWLDSNDYKRMSWTPSTSVT